MTLPTLAQTARAAQASYAGPWAFQSSGRVRVSLSVIAGIDVLAFKGTTLDAADICRDMRFLPWWNARVGWNPAGFQKGVAEVIDAIAAYLETAVRRDTRGFGLCGHSLGASEALIAGGWLASLGLIPLFVDAYEPARVALGSTLQNALRGVSRVTITHDGDDPVPDMPLPYHHPGEVMRLGRASLDPVSDHLIAKVIADLDALGV